MSFLRMFLRYLRRVRFISLTLAAFLPTPSSSLLFPPLFVLLSFLPLSRLRDESAFTRLSAPASTCVCPFWEHPVFFHPRSRERGRAGISPSKRCLLSGVGRANRARSADFRLFVIFSSHSPPLPSFCVLEHACERRSASGKGCSWRMWSLRPEGVWRLGGLFILFYFVLIPGRGARRLRSFSITRGRGAWIPVEEQRGMWGVSLPRCFMIQRFFWTLTCLWDEKGGWEFLCAFWRVGEGGA
jgi:hypothetical protein